MFLFGITWADLFTIQALPAKHCIAASSMGEHNDVSDSCRVDVLVGGVGNTGSNCIFMVGEVALESRVGKGRGLIQ